MVDKKTEKKEKKRVAKPSAKAVNPKASERKVVATSVTKKEMPAENDCGDKNCPVHGCLRTHGRVFEGMVVSDKMQRTVSVEWQRQLRVPKYERYLKRRTRVSAHNPVCIAAKKGDVVRIAECRPISKTVSFAVIEVLKL